MSTITKYDSPEEEAAAPTFALHHYFKTDANLPYNCYDYNNILRNRKGDFVCLLHGDYPIVEFKASELNTIRTDDSSKSATDRAELRRANGFGNATDRSIQLECGYNHSVYKLAECQAKAPPLGYITVFKEAPTMAQALLYMDHGLVWCTLASFGKFLNLLMAVKHTSLNFTWNQYTREGQGISLNLGNILQKQTRDAAKRDPTKPAKGLSLKPSYTQGQPLEAAPRGYKGPVFSLPKEKSKAGKSFYACMAKIEQKLASCQT